MRTMILKSLVIGGACLLQSAAFAATSEAPTKMYNDKVYVELASPNVSNEELKAFDVSQLQGEEAQNAARALIAARTADQSQVAANADEEGGLRAERYGRRGYYGRGYYGRPYYGGYYGRGYYDYGYPGYYYGGGACLGVGPLNICTP